VLRGWDRELEKWFPNLCVTVVRGPKELRKLCWRQPAHVWLTTFDTLRNDIRTVLNSHPKGFGLTVIDEAQRIKNPSTGYSRAVRQIDATYHWALSGTPLENRLEDVFGVFSFVKQGLFTPKEDYTTEQVNKLIKPYFLRRRKQDVLKDLPELVERHVWLRLEGEQRRSYEQLERQSVLKRHSKGEDITAQSILVLLAKLKQVCNRCPASDESAKLEWLRDNLEDIVAEGDKCLIFTQYRQKEFGGTDWLEERLPEYSPLNYGTASTDRGREAILREFKDRQEHSVFLAHPKTAGVGLNELVVANYVIHFDHWWNPATAYQATARAHRPGQKKKVFAYHLWVEDTVEERIFRKIEDKQRLYAEVVDSLSIGMSEEMLFEVYDELLAKYGLKAGGAAKQTAAGSVPNSMRTVDSVSDASTADAPADSEIPPREIWGSDPISIRQMAVLIFFRKAANTQMTKGQASEEIDKLFAIPTNKQAWEKAKIQTMDQYAGTPVFNFVTEKRMLTAKQAQRETLDDALVAIQLAIDSKRAARGWSADTSASTYKRRPIRDAKGKLSRWVIDWIANRQVLRNPLCDIAPVTFRMDGKEITRDSMNLGTLYDLRSKKDVQLWVGEPHQCWEDLSPDDVHTLVRAYEKAWLE
jgi:superfamily II DNA or RNA helicase